MEPPLFHSLPICVAFAVTACRATAVLTSPAIATGNVPVMAMHSGPSDVCDLSAVTVQHHRLTATAGVAWTTELPRHLQQILFDG
jgi:hypothetical protein